MAVQRKIAVVGAGVIGLSTALYIKTNLRLDGIPCKIEVFSEHTTPHTTSDGAAGLWEPIFVQGTPGEQQSRWGGETFEWLRHLRVQEDAGEMGVAQYSGYNLFHEWVEDPPWKDVVIGFRYATEAELKDVKFPMRHGWHFTNMSAQANRYCGWLLKRCKQQGIQFYRRKVLSLLEFAGWYDVVLNCTGLGSHQLTSDHDLIPLKGQIMKVSAPWIKDFTLVNGPDYVAYILPCTDFVVLGGTTESGRWDSDIEESVSYNILENCSKIMGSVKNAPILGQWSGLRPYRKTGVRLEREILQSKSSRAPLEVVHNYGHGGSGITFHWGCACEATSLAYQALGLPNSHHHDHDLLYKTISTPVDSSFCKL
ncbi:D-amino-acid oxidase-like [Corticium candelabrum]|uniref:D-amino-acid oxidase-like n=1 Tax=Corticium candelabrum TaxID=121492 RepID=UPI002E253B2D|nr:D-amino-acid oxidase-like [Corticium candelabrum]